MSPDTDGRGPQGAQLRSLRGFGSASRKEQLFCSMRVGRLPEAPGRDVFSPKIYDLSLLRPGRWDLVSKAKSSPTLPWRPRPGGETCGRWGQRFRNRLGGGARGDHHPFYKVHSDGKFLEAMQFSPERVQSLGFCSHGEIRASKKKVVVGGLWGWGQVTACRAGQLCPAASAWTCRASCRVWRPGLRP